MPVSVFKLLPMSPDYTVTYVPRPYRCRSTCIQHYCAYATPEHYGKGRADARATEYVCRDWTGIPSARFYDARELQARVLAPIERLGMRYQLLALRNKAELGEGIYCHFILEICK